MPEFSDAGFRELLQTRFKETALKAFLCRAARAYESFSLGSLSESFALPTQYLLLIVNKLILRGKLQAHLEKDFVIMDEQHKVSNEAKEL